MLEFHANKAHHTLVLHLDLRRCGVHLHGIRLLARGLKGCTGLVSLDLRANPFVNAESLEEGGVDDDDGTGKAKGKAVKAKGRGAGPKGKGGGEAAGVDATEARASQLFEKANYTSRYAQVRTTRFGFMLGEGGTNPISA